MRTTKLKKVCRYCNCENVIVRGMCLACLDVRARAYVRDDEEETTKTRRLPAKPTQAAPGSEEKIEVMRQRYLDGEFLHHPLDAKDGAVLRNIRQKKAAHWGLELEDEE